MTTDNIIALISVFVSVVSIAVSALLVVIQINKNANEQLKASLAQNRPLIIASAYTGMDLKATKKIRINFTRYVAKTPTYKAALAKNIPKDQADYGFIRVRNESDNHAHGVKIKLCVKNNSTNLCFEQEYIINIIASFCEYLFLVPQEYINNNYIDEYEVSISYTSISGEKIDYLCKYNQQSPDKVLNKYKGSYALKPEKIMDSFFMETLSDTIETIENNTRINS